jgi:hypothetical protein
MPLALLAAPPSSGAGYWRSESESGFAWHSVSCVCVRCLDTDAALAFYVTDLTRTVIVFSDHEE